MNQIVEGWKNKILIDLGFNLPEVSSLAKERMNICLDCPNINKEFYDSCSLCGCALTAKTKATEANCPQNKW